MTYFCEPEILHDHIGKIPKVSGVRSWWPLDISIFRTVLAIKQLCVEICDTSYRVTERKQCSHSSNQRY